MFLCSFEGFIIFIVVAPIMFHLRLLRMCDLYVHPKMFFFVFVLVFLDELMSQKFVYSSTRLQIGHQTSVYAVSTSLLGLLVPF